MKHGDSGNYLLAAVLAASVSLVSLLAVTKGGIDLHPEGLAPASPVTIRANTDTPEIEKSAPISKSDQ